MSADGRHRLLFLAPFPPQAAGRHGGSRAVAQLLRRIAKRYAVAVLYLREDSEGLIDPEIAALCEWAEPVERPLRERPSLTARAIGRARFYASLVRGAPIWVQGMDVAAFRVAVERAAREWRPDLVQVEYHVMGHYLESLHSSDAPSVLVFYETGEDAAGRGRPNTSEFVRRLDRRAWARFERKILRVVQCAVVLTDGDRAKVASRGVKVPIETISLGVEVPKDGADPLGSPPPTVVFVGNYRHDPNVDAALRLAQDIWPRVRRRRPDAVLALVGDSPPQAVAASAAPDVEVHGSVASVEPFIARAAVCVAPMREGGGMRTKVLEALAAGKAVVASPLAVAGLAVEDGRHLLLATTDEEFAAAILRLLDDEALRGTIAAEARAWSVANAGADRTAAAFEVLYERLIGPPRQ